MVKTRRSLNDGIEDTNYVQNPNEDTPDDKCDEDWPSKRELRRNPYRVKSWPRKYSRRLRAIKMPRIVFPESDTEGEKYSRRRGRPLRVYFADDADQKRSKSGRVIRQKNYIEDSGDKPIQQNVRRSNRQRKLLHLSFNESWITNEYRVKGYPRLFGQYGQMCTSFSESSSDEQQPSTSKRMGRPPNGISHTDGEPPTPHSTPMECNRRTSARCSGNKKIMLDPSDSEIERSMEESKPDIQTKTNDVSNEDDKQIKEKDIDRKERKNEDDRKMDITGNYSESNQASGYHLRKSRQRVQIKKKDPHCQSASDSGDTSESDENIRQPRRSNRTRKPTLLQLSNTPGQVKAFTLRNKPYSLRQRKPKMLLRKRSSPSTSSSTSSDSEEEINVSIKNKTKGRQKIRANQEHTERALRDIQPLELDGSITFSSVGGLEEHIKCLREMVLFPLMYPALFNKFNLRPPSGVLFHGPPGTGKTLLARALANECSKKTGVKVSFFLRKGADCLKKWVGESERQLKLLFQQARTMKPSIIFFDEIDALAPIRSVKQDQIHTSVVGTLLAEMDGLCERGDVIIMGATNRVDALDPALRRPGRLDRELYFPPPHTSARQQIIKIHTEKWSPKPSEDTLKEVAEITYGYGGSDLKALCSESILCALRRTYPQVYLSEDALLIDIDKVDVSLDDWRSALNRVVATSGRVAGAAAKPLSSVIEPLLSSQLNAVYDIVYDIASYLRLSNESPCPSGQNNVVLIKGDGADTILVPALLSKLDHSSVKEISPQRMATGVASLEQYLIATMSECRRAKNGSILWLRDIVTWSQHEAAMIAAFWRSGVAGNQCLLLASAKNDDLPEELDSLFPLYKDCIYTIREPSTSEIVNFLKPLVERACTPPDIKSEEPLPQLPKAPPPPPPRPSPKEMARRKRQDDYKLRELRIFLRDICRKLAANRRFYKFTKPVDLEEVTDYLEIIKQPMDLETMMTKVDMHKYNCAKEFLSDIDLICANALEYNPDRTSSDKQIRHEACSLRDHAHALIDVEMDSDFELQCQDISRRRQVDGNIDTDLPSFIYTASHATLPSQPNGTEEHNNDEDCCNGISEGECVKGTRHRKKRRRVSAWSKGKDVKRQKIVNKSFEKEETSNQMITDEESKENKPLSSVGDTINTFTSDVLDEDANMADDNSSSIGDSSTTHIDIHGIHNGISKHCDKPPVKSKKRSSGGGDSTISEAKTKLLVNKTEIDNLILKNAKVLKLCGVEPLLDLYTQLDKCIQRYRYVYDRTQLTPEFTAIIHKFVQHFVKK